MRKMIALLAKQIKEEVNKHLKADFIKEVQYLEWISSTMIV